MVLMMVLASMIIALALSARMTAVGLDAQRLIDYTNNRESNYLMARSVTEMGFELLRQDTGDTDSLKDYWALGEMTVQWEGVPVSLRVVDEESKFPLSCMQNNPDDCTYLQEALVRFMEKAGVRSGPQAVDQFLDWVDSNSVRRTHGAEEADYDDHRRFKDSPCHSIYEVLALPAWSELPHFTTPRLTTTAASVGLASGALGTAGVNSDSSRSENTSGISNTSALDDEKLKFGHSGKGKSRFGGTSFAHDVPEGQSGMQSATSPWQEWVSVYSHGKVNINTAPIQVLRCLDEDMSETLVAEIDSRRRSSAFKDLEELREVAGFSEDLRHRLKPYICFKSDVFEIRAVVHRNPGQVTLRTYVDRSNGYKILRWEMN